MAITFRFIEKITSPGGGANSVTFGSIPNTYTDLMLYFSVRVDENSTYPDQGFRITFNGSGSGYSTRLLYGFPPGAPTTGGASNSSQAFSNFYYGTANQAASNTFGNGYAYIPNYLGSNTKTIVSESGGSNDTNSAILAATYGVWANSAAVASLTLSCAGSLRFVANSTFTLYGILKA